MSAFSWFDGGSSAAPAARSSHHDDAAASISDARTKADAAASATATTGAGSMLRFATVDEVSNFRGSDELAETLNQLQYFSTAKIAANVMLKTDPEYGFVLQCGTTCVKIEREKLKIHRFIVDHYARRFPELCVLVQDATTYARVVKLLGNSIDEMDKVMTELEALVPSQLLAAVIAAACTTRGDELPAADCANVLAACDEVTSLEEVKQVLLEYIQEKMIFLCRNICAFLGSGIASQLVATAGSVDDLANMDAQAVMELGSVRAQNIGFAVKTSGFLQNVDLVQKQPAELRSKALRLVADRVVSLARIDANREGADESEGLRARGFVIRRILQWTDPLIQAEQRQRHGLSNRLYEKRSRVKRTEHYWGAAGTSGTTTRAGQRHDRG